MPIARTSSASSNPGRSRMTAEPRSGSQAAHDSGRGGFLGWLDYVLRQAFAQQIPNNTRGWWKPFCGGSFPGKLLPASDAAAPAPPPAGNMTRTIAKPTLRLGFFTRLLDRADPAERYRVATAHIIHAN